MQCNSSDATRTPRSRGWLIAVHLFYGLGLAMVLSLGFGWIVMLLWNALLPDLFHTSAIGYWQAVGLLLLARILTGGLGLGGHAQHVRAGKATPRRDYDEWWRQVGEEAVRERMQEDKAAGQQQSGQ